MLVDAGDWRALCWWAETKRRTPESLVADAIYAYVLPIASDVPQDFRPKGK